MYIIIKETSSAYWDSGGGSMQKVGVLKYSALNINVYVLMIFTAFSLKSGGGGGACPACPPYSASYVGTLQILGI